MSKDDDEKVGQLKVEENEIREVDGIKDEKD